MTPTTKAGRAYIEDRWGIRDGKPIDPRGNETADLFATIEREAARQERERIRAAIVAALPDWDIEDDTTVAQYGFARWVEEGILNEEAAR